MTLDQVLPTIGRCRVPALEAALWPAGAAASGGGDLAIGGISLVELAARFGTPCHVIDENDVRRRANAFRGALPEAEIAFAATALRSATVYRRLAVDGLSLCVRSVGELVAARSARFPAARILVHGSGLSVEDLKAAVAYRVGRFVCDSADEATRLTALANSGQPVLVRVALDTGSTANSREPDYSLASGAALDAVGHVLDSGSLLLAGLHCHLGSRVRLVATYENAVRQLIGLIADIRDRYRVSIAQLDLGGGFAAPYRQDEHEFDLTGLAHRLRVSLHYECLRRRLPVPRLTLEPGSAIVANAGVSLYRVATVRPGPRPIVSVHDGTRDHRSTKRRAVHEVARLLGRRSQAPCRPTSVVARQMRGDDLLAENVLLPTDVCTGDLLAIPATGAYHQVPASSRVLMDTPSVMTLSGLDPGCWTPDTLGS